jgi:starch synthase
VKILHVASEASPYSQTGGLGQVAGTLPRAIADLGHEVSLLTPLYPRAADALAAAGAAPLVTGIDLAPVIGGFRFEARILEVRAEADDRSLERLFVDCPALYDRPAIYGHDDDAVRFAVLSMAAREVAESRGHDVVHAHDWQTGLTCAYLRSLPRRPRLVFTIHNLAFQGVFPKELVSSLGLEWGMFHPDGLEFWDQLSFLKAGAAFADHITTVSPTYAAEIQTPERGELLDGFFRANAGRLTGILNGIDTDEWNPATDPRIAATFSAKDVSGKASCRRALANEIGLEVGDGDLFVGAVTRLAEQKGPDLLAEIVPAFPDLGVKLVLLGSGEAWTERRFELLEQWFPDHVRARIGFDDGLAHRIFAGCDAFVMPSRFEPCGLGQMIAMRYGTLPIASAVGGLVDTVDDSGDEDLHAGRGNGLRFFGQSSSELYGCVNRALVLWRDPGRWAAIRANAMAADWSWDRAARRYLALYAGEGSSTAAP